MGTAWSCGLSGSSSAGGISIPDDLVIEILLRLPAKRALKVCRLSKFYREVIESDYLIRKHYDLSIKKNPSFIISESFSLISRERQFLVDFDPTRSDLTVRELICPNLPNYEDADTDTDFVGSCRGIMCYTIVKDQSTSQSTHLAFWNPFTRAYRTTSAGKKFEGLGTRYVLGYNASTDDLKVLKIMYYLDDIQQNTAYEFAVYSSKMDSWKMMDEGLNKDLKLRILTQSCEVFVEGTNCVHILAQDLKLGDPISLKVLALKVLAFDFAADKFNLISLPENPSIGCLGLSSLDDCLCYYGLFDRYYWNVWIMKEYGVEKSWTRVFSVMYRDGLKPLTFVNDGLQLLLSSSYKLNMYLYDVGGKRRGKKLRFKKPNKLHWDFTHQHFLYVASHRQP